MKIALAQIKVVTAHPEANLKKGASYIEQAAKKGAKLIVFPEMWTTGFDWAKNKKSAPAHAQVLKQIGKLAKQYHIWVTGSTLFLNKKKELTNTALLFDPQGNEKARYSKTHLFGLMGEDKQMAAGGSLTLVKAPWGKTGFAICYDLRFPELFRAYAADGAKLILLPAAFPHPRLDHWKILTRARAIENQLFVVAVNQVGNSFFGHSCVIDPWGNTVAQAQEKETLLIANLDLTAVAQTRRKMNVFQDRRTDLY